MFELYDYQKPNVLETENIFKTKPICFNLSKMGLGKSIVALEISKKYTHTLVISYPNIIECNWAPLIQKYGFKINLLSINKLSGMKNTKLSHNFLTRTDVPLKGPIYKVTNLWKKMCEEGVLVIIDEMQLAKNKTLGADAIRVLLWPIMKNYINELNTDDCNSSNEELKINIDYLNNSRILMMSGTPVDEFDQIYNYFKIIGLASGDKLCAQLGAPPSTCIVELFKEYFLKSYSSSMADQVSRVQFKGYYQFVNTNISEINIAGSLTKTKLSEIEYAKVPAFVTQAKLFLLKNPCAKVVVGLFYKNSIRRISQELREYSPGIIDGSTDKLSRQVIIRKFQEPSCAMRLIIANIDIINAGINLDDEDGNYPRYCIINIGFMPPQQIAFRFNRINTKSNSELYILLCKEFDERQMFESQYNKSDTMCSIAEGIYPNSYEIIHSK